MNFDELFTKWKSEYSCNAFIRDGIVDPAHYDRPHILFILRDMNCRHERDLCADLRRDGSGWRTWNNIGRWTKALLDGDGEYPWDMSSPSRAAQLRRVGKILEEICLCDPGMIICCGLASSGIKGNAALLKDHVLPVSTEWASFQSRTFDRDWQYYFTEINKKQIPVISFCHPQVTNLNGSRGHEKLFIPLFQDMLYIKELFLKNTAGSE